MGTSEESKNKGILGMTQKRLKFFFAKVAFSLHCFAKIRGTQKNKNPLWSHMSSGKISESMRGTTKTFAPHLIFPGAIIDPSKNMHHNRVLIKNFKPRNASC